MKQKHNKINMGLVFFVVALFVASATITAMGNVVINEEKENDVEINTLDGLPNPPSMFHFEIDYFYHRGKEIFSVGQKIRFEAVATDSDQDDSLTFYVNWSDGTDVESFTAEEIGSGYYKGVTFHRYKSKGIFEPTCYAQDDYGLNSSKWSTPVKVLLPKSKSLYQMQFDLLEISPLLARLIKIPLFYSLPVFQK